MDHPMKQAAPNDFIRLLAQPTTAGAIHARLPGSTLFGDAERAVLGIGSLASTAPGVLTFCDAPDANERLVATRAAVVIVPRDAAAVPAT